MENLKEVEILIVEDNPQDAEMAMRAFKQNKLTNKLHIVEDGVKALDFLFAKGKYADRKNMNKPKIILLDLKLPKLDGLEVLQKIKSNPDTKIIPVIILTSSKEETDIIKSYQLGVNSYIVKPVDFDKFVKAVRDLGLYWLLLNENPT
ncbi:MAG: response regulator [Bacteroidota bacterium]